MIDYILFVLYSLLIFFLGKRLGEESPKCNHQWEPYHKEQYTHRDSDGDFIRSFDRYHARCAKCGEMKKFDMK